MALIELLAEGWVNLGEKDNFLYMYNPRSQKCGIYNIELGKISLEMSGVRLVDFKRFHLGEGYLTDSSKKSCHKDSEDSKH